MAKKKKKINKGFQKRKIQDTKGSNFKNYQSDNGGGTPVSGGGRGAWHRAGEPGHRVGQPRTDDGKFTYNSVNGKGLKYKSRGKTVNPLLTEGQNGIYIEDVERHFSQQSGAYWNKYKDKWYQQGDMIVGKNKKTYVSGETVWEVAKRSYDEVKGEFTDESNVFGKNAKVGAKSKEEKAAIQNVKKTRDESFVINQKTGGIKNVNKANNFPFVKKTPTPQPAPNPSISVPPNNGLGQPQTNTILKAPGQGTSANNGGQGLTQTNMNTLNNLFGGNANQNQGNAPTPTIKPSLQGFFNKKNSTK